MRRLHPDLQQRVRPDTLLKYKQQLDPFIAFLQQRWELHELSPEDVDLLIMEFRTEFELTRSQHVLLLAAVEFFIPHCKNKLIVTREAIKGRINSSPIEHTVPLSYECAYLFAAFHSSRGLPRLGAALLVQMGTGLRPSELLGLVREHVFVPYNPRERISLRLGVDHSTKVKREQFVQVDPKLNPHAYKLLKLLHAATTDRGKLFPFSYSAYKHSFQLAEKHFDLKLGLTAHSGRAGFATSRIMSGADAKQVQAEGRWRSDTSFHTYVDVVGSLHAKTQIALGNLQAAADWCRDHIEDYFGGIALLDEQKSCRQCGDETRLEAQRKSLLGASSSRPLHAVPEAAVARRADQQADVSNSRSTSSHTCQQRNPKGKGRGRLHKPGSAKQSIFG